MREQRVRHGVAVGVGPPPRSDGLLRRLSSGTPPGLRPGPPSARSAPLRRSSRHLPAPRRERPQLALDQRPAAGPRLVQLRARHPFDVDQPARELGAPAPPAPRPDLVGTPPPQPRPVRRPRLCPHGRDQQGERDPERRRQDRDGPRARAARPPGGPRPAAGPAATSRPSRPRGAPRGHAAVARGRARRSTDGGSAPSPTGRRAGTASGASGAATRRSPGSTTAAHRMTTRSTRRPTAASASVRAGPPDRRGRHERHGGAARDRARPVPPPARPRPPAGTPSGSAASRRGGRRAAACGRHAARRGAPARRRRSGPAGADHRVGVRACRRWWQRAGGARAERDNRVQSRTWGVPHARGATKAAAGRLTDVGKDHGPHRIPGSDARAGGVAVRPHLPPDLGRFPDGVDLMEVE